MKSQILLDSPMIIVLISPAEKSLFVAAVILKFLRNSMTFMAV